MKNGILLSVDMEARGRRILDTYHDIKGDFLQLYLNEFCYKFNRRYFGFHLFDRLELCACTYRTSFKHRIY